MAPPALPQPSKGASLSAPVDSTMSRGVPSPEPRAALRIVAPAHQEVYRTLRSFPLFDGLPNDELLDRIAAGELQLIRAWRDEIVADAAALAAGGPRIFLVKRGQVAVGVFPPGVLERERAESAEVDAAERQRKIRTQGPMIRLAEKNLATFGEGELWNSEALGGLSEGAGRCAFYAVAPAELVVASVQCMARLTSRHPFFAERLRGAVEAARGRLGGLRGIQLEILDFWVRHGLSVAETLRVRQVDRCIECLECEKACADRYGHKRLTIHGPRLGMVDFVYACRTCTDARCVSPCNYDAIRFDGRRREVVIDEAACTGCASCAEACPYGSIEMVELDDPRDQRFHLRLLEAGALAHGEGAPRQVAATRIASKCDHCASYGDQACVSHCPTGALVEIAPADLFQGGALPDEPFRKGLGITDGAEARVKPRRVTPAILWGVALGGFLLALVEIVLRLWQPSWSLQYATLRLGGLEAEIARMKVGYRPGCDLAVTLGYVGTALLVAAMLYPLRKRSRLLQRLGSSAAWFDFHLMGGIIGPLFITLHSATKLDNWVSFAFWSMILVIVSGLVGRYLVKQVPEALFGGELDELEDERALARLRTVCPDGVALVAEERQARRARASRVAATGLQVVAMLWAAGDDLVRPFRRLRRRARLGRTSAPAGTRAELSRRAGRLILADRRRLLVPGARTVLHQWRKVHVPFTFLMIGLVVLHIVIALTYSM